MTSATPLRGLCSLALLSEDESVLHYFGLSPEGEGTHAHVGTFPRQNTGSGVAISLKKPILTSIHAPRHAPAPMGPCCSSSLGLR